MNVDELLVAVKAEAARREGRTPAMAGGMQPSHVAGATLMGPRYLVTKNRSHVRDFLPLFGEEFISAAFQAVLWRDVDLVARDAYLDAILCRQISKWEVLARLRYSAEGRRKKATVNGVLMATAFSLAYRIPIVGFLTTCAVHVLALPAYLRDHRHQDSGVFAILRAVGR